jgi:peptidoglycan/xylan/chitin deacetylase (PgdA/CDA1 family)
VTRAGSPHEARTRPIATLSIDVDPVDLHLIGYGWPGLPPDPVVYNVALPRLAEVFARHRMRATFFCVGRDAASRASSLRALADAGHEIASHTWSHPIQFATLKPERQAAELVDSRRSLSDAAGREVVGFRAPNFDMDARVVPHVVAAGYRYDASAYPSPLLVPARVVLALKSRDPFAVLGMRPWPFTWNRAPYMWRTGGAELREFPVAVTPWLRLPVYHTMRWVVPAPTFTDAIRGFARRGEPLSYILHGVDALGMAEDGVDARLRRHPGMNRRLDDKLAVLDGMLSLIGEHFDVRTYAEQL